MDTTFNPNSKFSTSKKDVIINTNKYFYRNIFKSKIISFFIKCLLICLLPCFIYVRDCWNKRFYDINSTTVLATYGGVLGVGLILSLVSIGLPSSFMTSLVLLIIEIVQLLVFIYPNNLPDVNEDLELKDLGYIFGGIAIFLALLNLVQSIYIFKTYSKIKHNHQLLGELV